MAYLPLAWDAKIPTKRGDGSDWVSSIILSCPIAHLFIFLNPGERRFTAAKFNYCEKGETERDIFGVLGVVPRLDF